MVNNSMEPLDAVFGALSDPSRRYMLSRLAHGPMTVSDIARPLPISLPAASKHIRVLELSGLVTRVRQGRTHTLTLNADALNAAEDWIKTQRRFWDTQLDSLERFLADEEQEEK